MENVKLPEVASYEDFEKIRYNKELWKNAALKIIDHHGLERQSLSLFPDGSNIVFAHGPDQIIKIFVPILKSQFEAEKLVLKQIYGKLSVHTPKLEYTGELEGWPCIIMSRVEGRTLERLWEQLSFENKAHLISKLGKLIGEMHSIPIQGLEEIDSHWNLFLEKQIVNCAERHRSLNLPLPLVDEIPKYLKSIRHLLPRGANSVLLTGEYTPMNLVVKEIDGIWDLNGLIDFGDSMLGAPEYDLLGPGAFLIQGDKRLAREFLISYGYSEEELTPDLSRKLTALTLLHQYSNLNVQIRIPNWQTRIKSLEDVENLMWEF